MPFLLSFGVTLVSNVPTSFCALEKSSGKGSEENCCLVENLSYTEAKKEKLEFQTYRKEGGNITRLGFHFHPNFA
jgi:hypothetical protein